MNRACRACGETDPARFYASQRTRFCKKCWRERYPQAGYARAIQAKIAMVKCMDCPMEINDDNHYLFDLDHRVGTQKYSSVALMRTSSNAKFQEEIAKCDLVCLMCHRKRTISRLRERAILSAEDKDAVSVPVVGTVRGDSPDAGSLGMDRAC